ncbi:hypothetical protein Golax_024794, partial [Gossypium laxum]|nr:hypothetical protein [Gossypium laxum]
MGDSTLIPDFGSLSHGLVRDCPFNTVVAGVPKWLILRLKNPPFIPFSATRFNLGMPLHPPAPALLLSRLESQETFQILIAVPLPTLQPIPCSNNPPALHILRQDTIVCKINKWVSDNLLPPTRAPLMTPSLLAILSKLEKPFAQIRKSHRNVVVKVIDTVVSGGASVNFHVTMNWSAVVYSVWVNDGSTSSVLPLVVDLVSHTELDSISFGTQYRFWVLGSNFSSSVQFLVV